jgi:hypothetical protein
MRTSGPPPHMVSHPTPRLQMSMLEVYNETVQDLLGDPANQKSKGLDIRVNPKGQVCERVRVCVCVCVCVCV